RRGVAPADTTLDCVGPFAREMRTLVAVMAAIAPGFDRAQATAAAAGCTVAQLVVDADPAIAAALDAAVRASGLRAHTVVLDEMPASFAAGLTVINAETSRAFGHLVGTGRLGADLDARLRMAAATTPAALAEAEAVRARFTAQVDAALEHADVLVLPTLPALPITLQQARDGVSVIAMSSLIRPFNLSGHPALSLPLPLAGSPLKAGLQIVGRKGADERVCAIAAHFEAALAA
ncbi:amidase family protein, partial [Burkholderia cenocepacia]|nr:amidase family protein [Burkholderia cenocepacia]